MEESPLENIRELRELEDRVEASSALTTTRSSVNARDCRTRMAQVEYAFPVDAVHGRISKKHKIGFAHRKESGKNYTTSYGKRSTPVSDDEKQYRTYWGQLASAVAARLQDPTKQPQDQLDFKNQTEHSTLRKFVWAKVAEEMNN